MDRLVEVLELGYAAGEALGAFNNLEAHAQGSKVVTLCGLIIGQRRAFSQARAARTELKKWLEHYKKEWTRVIESFVPKVLAGVVRSYLLPTDEFDLIAIQVSLQDERLWRSWHIEPVAQLRLTSVVKQWLACDDVHQVLLIPTFGIGPWTRKAFALLHQNANLLLHEDKWVQTRWTQLTKLLHIYPQVTLSHIERNPQLVKPITLRQLSFLLWRATPDGIRNFYLNRPTNPNSFV